MCSSLLSLLIIACAVSLQVHADANAEIALSAINPSAVATIADDGYVLKEKTIGCAEVVKPSWGLTSRVGHAAEVDVSFDLDCLREIPSPIRSVVRMINQHIGMNTVVSRIYTTSTRTPFIAAEEDEERVVVVHDGDDDNHSPVYDVALIADVGENMGQSEDSVVVTFAFVPRKSGIFPFAPTLEHVGNAGRKIYSGTEAELQVLDATIEEVAAHCIILVDVGGSLREIDQPIFATSGSQVAFFVESIKSNLHEFFHNQFHLKLTKSDSSEAVIDEPFTQRRDDKLGFAIGQLMPTVAGMYEGVVSLNGTVISNGNFVLNLAPGEAVPEKAIVEGPGLYAAITNGAINQLFVTFNDINGNAQPNAKGAIKVGELNRTTLHGQAKYDISYPVKIPAGQNLVIEITLYDKSSNATHVAGSPFLVPVTDTRAFPPFGLSAIGPFTTSNLIGGDPLIRWGGIEQVYRKWKSSGFSDRTVYPSEMGKAGHVRWNLITMNMTTRAFSTNFGNNFDEQMAVATRQHFGKCSQHVIGWFVGDITIHVDGFYIVECEGCRRAKLSDGRTFLSLRATWLKVGSHTIFLQTEGIENQPLRVKVVESKFPLQSWPVDSPDIVDGFLTSTWIGVRLMSMGANVGVVTSATSLDDRFRVVSYQIGNGCSCARINVTNSDVDGTFLSIPNPRCTCTTDYPGGVAFPPDSVVYVTFAVEATSSNGQVTLRASETTNEIRLILALSIAINGDQYQMKSEAKLRYRESREQYIFTYLFGGRTQSAAARSPEAPCNSAANPSNYPLLLSLHGFGANFETQCYAHFPRPNAWVFCPRSQNHNWEGQEVIMVKRGMMALRQIALTHPTISRGCGVDLRSIFYTGHSMGGHGSWIHAFSSPSRTIGVLSRAGWSQQSSYLPTWCLTDSHIDPMLQAVRAAHTADYDTMRITLNLDVAGSVFTGAQDVTVSPRYSRQACRLLTERFSPRDEPLLGLCLETPGSHWWWDDGGIMDSESTRLYVDRVINATLAGNRPYEALTSKQFRISTFSPSTIEPHRGIQIIQSLNPLAEAALHIDLLLHSCDIATYNVRRFILLGEDNQCLSTQRPSLNIDGVSYTHSQLAKDIFLYGDRSALSFCYDSRVSQWGTCPQISGGWPGKSPSNSGRHDLIHERCVYIVYGTINGGINLKGIAEIVATARSGHSTVAISDKDWIAMTKNTSFTHQSDAFFTGNYDDPNSQTCDVDVSNVILLGGPLWNAVSPAGFGTDIILRNTTLARCLNVGQLGEVFIVHSTPSSAVLQNQVAPTLPRDSRRVWMLDAFKPDALLHAANLFAETGAVSGDYMISDWNWSGRGLKATHAMGFFDSDWQMRREYSYSRC